MAQGSQTYGSTDQRTDVPDVGFSPTELYSLCENITSNIYTINANWKKLEYANKNIGTNKDNQNLRDSAHITQITTSEIVNQISKDIARLTVLMRKGDKQQKLQIEKLTTDFKDAMQRYSEMQESTVEKMKRHILRTPSMEQSMDADDKELECLLQVQENDYRATQRNLEHQQGLFLERDNRIEHIEGIILNVNQIMSNLAELIQKQGETVDTIDNHIENVYGNVELGVQELDKGSKYLSKYRRKVFISLLFAIIVVVILIIILVTKLS